MEIEEILDIEKWDDFIKNTREGTVFHTSSWFQASPHNFLRIGVFQKGKLLAGAILQINEHRFGTLGTLAPYLGPVFAKFPNGEMVPETKRKVMSKLARGIRERVPKSTFFVSPWLETLQQFICTGFEAKLLYTTVLRTTDLDETQAQFSPTLRRNIKAALQIGLTVEQSSEPSELLTLVRQSFVRQGHSIWFNLEEADACMRHLAKLGQAICFITRNQDGLPVAAAGIVWDWHRSYYILGGYDHTRSHRGGSSLALWSAIQFTHQELGLTEIDLEGSHLPAIERFFRQFGGRWLPFYYVTEARNPLINTQEI
ncbi:GNAT family N-acetyltransferase [Planktothrix sp. FACHB-1355]|uniref:GNAT family N-acetyltransferase n=1 Tax=Aerosakkonema funiforme FACHB-1375 TaxID=2949571 RepID=A0A926VB70_9CYAN|nr:MULTISPECIES: GNAT family N-acetyltransferase [Oscillatoriales]MBD2180598.1 GNAT family N-acetyltransferase [Aerosakkonema funiforme FACHB-1375]MBD3557642.1 GNAT family N-acetyltransferase [Planktothrix sp. FACHB-1355]